MHQLAEAIQGDNGYAWSWHCAVACCAMDEGVEHANAHRIADRFMAMAFQVVATEPVQALYVSDKAATGTAQLIRLPEVDYAPTNPSNHLWAALYKQPAKKP